MLRVKIRPPFPIAQDITMGFEGPINFVKSGIYIIFKFFCLLFSVLQQSGLEGAGFSLTYFQ